MAPRTASPRRGDLDRDRGIGRGRLNLAGIIEYDQRDLDPAQADLEAAIAAAGEDCTARWYLGLVHRQRKRWLASGRAFEAAMVCYRERAQATADRIRALEARADLDPAYRAGRIATLGASVMADTRQRLDKPRGSP